MKKIAAQQVDASEVTALRELYRHEMNCQIVHDSWLRRGFVAAFLFLIEGKIAGYGTITVGGLIEAVMVNEFYVLPAYRVVAVWDRPKISTFLSPLSNSFVCIRFAFLQNELCLRLCFIKLIQRITSRPHPVARRGGASAERATNTFAFERLAREHVRRHFGIR